MSDHDDNDHNETPLIIRTPNSGDADAVDRQVGEQLGKLTIGEQANLTIPTPAEVSRHGLAGDIQDSYAGKDQQNIELSRLQNNLEVVKLEVVKARAQGYVPNELMNRFNAAANSYQYQADAIRRTTPDPASVEAESDNALLLSAYKTGMEGAVNRMMNEHRVDRGTALGLVAEQRAALGDAAVLPQYASIKARMDAKYPKDDS